MPDLKQIQFLDPGEIDGEPQEVARKASAQLAAVLTEVAPLIEGTVRQVQNGGMQDALTRTFDEDDERTLTGDAGELQEAWREHRPQQAAMCESLATLAPVLRDRAARLAYVVSRGE
jgi:hypothetical protein